MKFKRAWDDSCPKIYEQWKDDNGTWTIQDLPPEDDEEALDMMVNVFIPDERMCSMQNLLEDPVSVQGIRDYWVAAISQRTSLACYRQKDGVKELVALNVCPVKCIDDEDGGEIKGDRWRQVAEGLDFASKQTDVFRVLGVDKFLSGAGLVVRKDIRGARLGARLLEAREPLCRHLGITATVTLFTGLPSQKLAVRVGFQDIVDVTFADLAKSGLNYPEDATLVMKLMAKKYD